MIKVSNLPTNSVCSAQNKTVAKKVSFFDMETRNLIVEVKVTFYLFEIKIK